MAATNPTPAQDEFDSLVSASARDSARDRTHPEDRDHHLRDGATPDRDTDRDDDDDDDRLRDAQIDAAMRIHAADAPIKLPPASFDKGRTTGVKGVIADARSFEAARRSKWSSRVRAARRSIFGIDSATAAALKEACADPEPAPRAPSAKAASDDESFLQEWRESRRKELESGAGRCVRNRRTSPSVRTFGRLDTVDALGYLDAIEKVGRDTVVVVFVYDRDCDVSHTVETALKPLVSDYPAVHFVKIHYDDIEFDNAAVPSILAYRNQGDLIANLTGLIEMIPEHEDLDSDFLVKLLRQHSVL